MTTAREQIVSSLGDKEYRDAFVSEHISQGTAFQIRTTRKERGWSQAELARRAEMKQARISELENPDYECATLSTLKRLASALDVALSVRFVPFSKLVDYSLGISQTDLAVPNFDNDAGLEAAPSATWNNVQVVFNDYLSDLAHTALPSEAHPDVRYTTRGDLSFTTSPTVIAGMASKQPLESFADLWTKEFGTKPNVVPMTSWTTKRTVLTSDPLSGGIPEEVAS